MENTTEPATTSSKPFDIMFNVNRSANEQALTLQQRQGLAMEELRQRANLSADIAARQVRLQASSADMDQTVQRVHELSRSSRADFRVRSTHTTASGETTIIVQRNNTLLIVIGIIVTTVLVLAFK